MPSTTSCSARQRGLCSIGRLGPDFAQGLWRGLRSPNPERHEVALIARPTSIAAAEQSGCPHPCRELKGRNKAECGGHHDRGPPCLDGRCQARVTEADVDAPTKTPAAISGENLKCLTLTGKWPSRALLFTVRRPRSAGIPKSPLACLKTSVFRPTLECQIDRR